MGCPVSFWRRVGNLWTGFLSIWIKGVEVRNPEIAYENSIESMKAKHDALRSSTAAIIGRRDQISARLDKEQRALFETQGELSAAIATNQDDVAILLIQKQEELDKSVKDLEIELAGAVKDADEAKASLIMIRAEITKLKAEKDRNLARIASAEARLKINAQLDGLSIDDDVKALDNVREHIKDKVAEANLASELNESDLDVRLAKLRKTSGTLTAQAKLAELKAAHQVPVSVPVETKK